VTRRRRIAGLVVALAVTSLAAGIGGLATRPAVGTWYQDLRKPSWTPPDWVFGPVWTILYTTMAVAAWLVWRAGPRPGVRAALVLYAVQLALNAAWSPLFFGLRMPGAALVALAALWLAVGATTAVFWRVSRPAGALLLPYLAWATFAGALNLAIWRLNG